MSGQFSSSPWLPCNCGHRDVAGASLGSEVDGIISTEQSVYAMLQVISSKTLKDSGTFWTWEGKVNQDKTQVLQILTFLATPMVNQNNETLMAFLIRISWTRKGMSRWSSKFIYLRQHTIAMNADPGFSMKSKQGKDISGQILLPYCSISLIVWKLCWWFGVLKRHLSHVSCFSSLRVYGFKFTCPCLLAPFFFWNKKQTERRGSFLITLD